MYGASTQTEKIRPASRVRRVAWSGPRESFKTREIFEIWTVHFSHGPCAASHMPENPKTACFSYVRSPWPDGDISGEGSFLIWEIFWGPRSRHFDTR